MESSILEWKWKWNLNGKFHFGLAWPGQAKAELLFRSQQEVLHKLLGHPEYSVHQNSAFVLVSTASREQSEWPPCRCLPSPSSFPRGIAVPLSRNRISSSWPPRSNSFRWLTADPYTLPNLYPPVLAKVARWQNLIPSFPWIAPGWSTWRHNPRKGRDQILQRSGAEP